MNNLKILTQYYLLVTKEEFVHKALLATFYRRILKCHCCLMLLLCERFDHLKLRGKCWLQHSPSHQRHPHYHHHHQHYHHHHHNQVQLGQFNKVKEILCVKRLV